MSFLALAGISWATPFLILAGYGIFAFFFGRAGKGTDKKNKIRWTPLEAVAVTIALYFVSQILASLAILLCGLLLEGSVDRAADWVQDSQAAKFLFILFADGLLVGFLIIFLKRRRATLKTIGFWGKPGWKDAGYVLLGFGAYFLMFTVVFWLIERYVPAVNVSQEQDVGFSKQAQNVALLPIFLALVVLPAFVEEILARGFLYTGLKNGLHKYWAVFITSALFGLVHLQFGNDKPLLWVAAADTFILSLVLIYIKEKTGRLWAPIGLHMLKNGLTFLAVFVLKVT